MKKLAIFLLISLSILTTGVKVLAEEVLKDYSNKTEAAETRIQSVIDSDNTTTDEKILDRINSLQVIIQENENHSDRSITDFSE